MNKKINELLKQAGIDMQSDLSKFGMNEDMNGYNCQGFMLEKFAELIVRECEQVSLKNSHRDDDMGAVIAGQIKKHFGVEE